MKADLYNASVTVYANGLRALAHFLRKAEAHALANGVSEDAFVNDRLADDMLPLYRQVQIVCDFAVKAPARAIGVEGPPEPTAQSLSGLYQAIETAQKQVAAYKPEQFEGRDEVVISFPVGPNEMSMPAGQYILGFATPNFYFHLVTAYAILRKSGAPLGKRDYFGMPG